MKNVGILPIFDRLVDENLEEPFEKIAKKYVSENELKESIMNDLSLLLNTRVSPFWREYEDKISMPYIYGADITAPNSVETVFEIQALESKVKRVIDLFEPRLSNTQVHFTSLGANPGSACVQINADVLINQQRVPLTFPIVVDI